MVADRTGQVGSRWGTVLTSVSPWPRCGWDRSSAGSYCGVVRRWVDDTRAGRAFLCESSAWLVLLGGLVLVGVYAQTVMTDHDQLFFGTVSNHLPFFARWHPRLTGYAVVAVGGLVLSALFLVWGRSALGRRGFAAGLFLAAVVSRVSLNVERRGVHELIQPLVGREGANDYITTVSSYVADPTGYLDQFAERVPHLATHPAGHPPGPTILMGTLEQVGLGGAWGEALLVILIGALGAPLVYGVGQSLLAERDARVAAIIWVFSPMVLIEGATAMDAVFATVATAAAVALVRGRWSLGAALVGISAFLSYALLAVAGWVGLVRLAGGQWRAALQVAVAAVAGVVAVYGVATLGFGYDPVSALSATHDRYYAGIARHRPWSFWVVGNLAVFFIGVGFPVAIGFARACSHRAGVALALLAVIGVATLTGYTKAEVERIWLFMVPWACLSAAPLLGRHLPVAVTLLAGQALVVEVLYYTTW